MDQNVKKDKSQSLCAKHCSCSVYGLLMLAAPDYFIHMCEIGRLRQTQYNYDLEKGDSVEPLGLTCILY